MGDQNRRTPPWLFALLQRTLDVKFGLDAFASAENALCKRYFDEAVDAFTQQWKWHTFCNHPWKQTYRVIPYALEQALKWEKVVCVVGPTGCSQKWFHEEVRKYATVLAPDQRIVFFASDGSGPTHGADRDTMVYVFDGRTDRETRLWSEGHQGWSLHPLHVQGLVEVSR